PASLALEKPMPFYPWLHLFSGVAPTYHAPYTVASGWYAYRPLPSGLQMQTDRACAFFKNLYSAFPFHAVWGVGSVKHLEKLWLFTKVHLSSATISPRRMCRSWLTSFPALF